VPEVDAHARSPFLDQEVVFVNDPIARLKKDHREANAFLKSLAAGRPGARRRATVKKLDAALQLRM
jgi:hypothetical protein